jgi:hypothetical protein
VWEKSTAGWLAKPAEQGQYRRCRVLNISPLYLSEQISMMCCQ